MRSFVGIASRKAVAFLVSSSISSAPEGARRAHAISPSQSPANVETRTRRRYTYRVAISNRRLVSLDGNLVRFRYKDRRNGGQERIMTLSVAEFVRRYMQHVLPTSFVRVRHFGFLAGSVRKVAGEKVRAAIGERPAPPIISDESWDAQGAPGGQRRFPQCQRRITPPCGGVIWRRSLGRYQLSLEALQAWVSMTFYRRFHRKLG